ncbi:BTB/POZ domain-containing protein KCTD9-like [Argopecten irradians]|uniref:BTB/POZ domain-containing protein KCTD9-like n=1 Tax=Argopecten irradians TaxID=31199 RepID=UPI00371043FE
MKRVTLFRNGSDIDGKLVAVTHSTTLQDILQEANKKLGIDAQLIYTPKGAVLDDVLFIRDEDVFYISTGEPFRKPGSKSASTVSEPASDITKKFIKGHERKMSSGTTSACHTTEWVTLNVGGQIFTTTRSTLTQQDSGSMLARMFGEEKTVTWHSSVDESGAYLIDRSPRYFEPILNYLRHGQLVLDKNINPQGVLEEARFFGLTSLMDSLEEIIEDPAGSQYAN